MVFPVDEVTHKYGNKYEAIIVAAKEGRRINSLRLAAGGAPEGSVKATVEGMRRVMNNDVTWHYIERAPEPFGPEPEE
jgi:DNA-directed RNA polymerase subunit K/omega